VYSRRRFLKLALASGVLVPIVAACGQNGGNGTPVPNQPTTPPAASPSAVATPTAAATVTPVASPTPAATATPTTVKRTAEAAAFGTDAQGHPVGSLHSFTVTIDHLAPTEAFRLDFPETDVGQLGSQWVASGWMAACVGALLIGQDLAGLRVSWETTGFIDGPSASGLMTAAFIAALLGQDIKPDVAFTGTINPDGSIGPVGGILYKLRAAIAKGKKTFLLPIGQREDTDLETKDTVDLVNLGQNSGVTVKEVATLDDAYQILTGVKLPQTYTGTSNPELSADAHNTVKSDALSWNNDYQDAVGRFQTVSPTAQKYFTTQVQSTAQLHANYQKAMDQGDVVGAYNWIQAATISASVLSVAARGYEVWIQQNSPAAGLVAAKQSAGASRFNSLFERLKTYDSAVTSTAILAVDGWSSVAAALAVDLAAQREYSAGAKATTTAEVASHLYAYAYWQSLETYIAQGAQDTLTLTTNGGSTSPKVDEKSLAHWANVLKNAAEANLSYFNSLILDDLAKQNNLNNDVVHQWFVTQNLDYAVATYGVSPGALDYLQKSVGDPTKVGYAQLGFATASFQASSRLIAQYYSLQAETDKNGTITGYARDTALPPMLDSAVSQAESQIAAVGDRKDDPNLATFYFLEGRVQREGNSAQKLNALADFWDATLLAHLQQLIAAKS